MGRGPNKDREGSKNGSCRGDAHLGCIFSTIPLLVRVCLLRRYLRKVWVVDSENELSNLLRKINSTINNLNGNIRF